MGNSVIIKSNSYGISVYLNNEMSYQELLEEVIEKFKDSAKFFKNAKMVVSFEGKDLTEEQTVEMLEAITTYSGLNIMCLVDKKLERENYFQQKLAESLSAQALVNGQFYRGSLQSGQILESEISVIILGSVEEGAKVYSKGNVIVMGSLSGKVYAGIEGNKEAFVAALQMDPVQIKIGDIIARKPENILTKFKFGKKAVNEVKIAYVENDSIFIEPITNDIFNKSTDLTEE